MVLRWNRTATKLRFSGGHVTVFLEFQKWPSPVTNVPKQQHNYHLSWTPASTIWSDRLTARSGVARQPNYSPWQVDLCCCQDWRCTYRWTQAVQTNMRMEGEKVDWRTRFYETIGLSVTNQLRIAYNGRAFVLSSIAQLKACTGAVPVTDALFDPDSVYWVAHSPPM